jgi:hypothetical protein
MIIEEKTSVSGYFLCFIILMLVSLLSACDNHPDTSLPKRDTYFKFSHVKEIVDSVNGNLIRYELLEDSITNSERDTLLKLLNELHWKYSLSTGGEVFIQVVSLGDIEGLSYLNGELDRRLKR